jgi:hypothetical protein
MPRYRTLSAASATSPLIEFDLCVRCSANGDILRTVLSGKFGIRVADDAAPPVEPVSHRSYEFQLRPAPCISCARILTAEDD